MADPNRERDSALKRQAVALEGIEKELKSLNRNVLRIYVCLDAKAAEGDSNAAE